ncbi:MAG: hypothetical protein JSS86_13865 [Cyanobacteria bacterium SZAS LIN-2]|nr:hypothetical protein [Cyanobacteria bacterium SZAS LIN-2]
MGIFSNFFKSNPLPEDEIEESENVMRKLQEQRQENTSQWVASIQDPNSLLPPTYTKVKIPPKPSIEDVDKREEPDDYVYTPPVEAMYTPFDDGDTLSGLARVSHRSSTDWVARIFQEFELQGSTFNASAQGTNLVLSIHPPKYYEEVVSGGVYGKDTKVRFFKGYVSATFWGMLLHGHHDKIDVYIVPSDAILQLTLSDINQSGFSPYVTIDSQIVDGDLEWHVGGTTISYEAIPNLARQLLADLIKVASGKIKNEELFADYSGGLKLGQGAQQTLTQAMRIIKEDSPAPAASPVATATKQLADPTSSMSDLLANMATFAAGERMLEAMTRDMTVISRMAEPGSAPGIDAAGAEKLRALITAMRTLHGQISTFVAENKPGRR